VLTDAKVQEILRWHEQKRAIRKILDSMKTLRQLARELGVSPATVSYVIARRGVYKQPSPEQRDAEIGKRRRRIAKLRERGFL
jgi:predicted transcriptional regulator